MKILILAAAMSVMVIGCSPQGGVTATPDATTQGASAAESVICDFFAAGGPVDDVRAAAASAMRGENEAAAARDAIDGIKKIAERASGGKQDDLLALANAMNDASMKGDGYVGWSPAYEAFYVKYAEQCGQKLAN